MPTATKTKPKSYAGKTAGPTINSAAWRKEQLDEAIENVAHWKRVAAATENPVTRSNALARVRLWETTRDSRAMNVRLLNR